jgi:vacuolar-type H+-ATPase subunit I/STV1
VECLRIRIRHRHTCSRVASVSSMQAHRPAHWFHPWDKITRFIILFNGLANLTLGISFLLWADISAENVLSHYFPSVTWPVLWVIAGVLGIGGLWSATLARYSFVLSAIIMGIFTTASVWAVVIDGRLVAIPTVVFFSYITVLLTCIASLIRQRDDIIKQVREITVTAQQKLDGV